MTSPLLIDVSPYCPVRPSQWQTVADAGDPWSGIVLKAGQGLRDTGQWVRSHAEAIRATGLRLGYYWFLQLDQSGEAQADKLAALMAEQPCTILPVVDVEEGGGNAAAVKAAGPAIVERVTRAFVERMLARTGCKTILYCGGWLRSLGLRSMLGCEYLWLAAYVKTLPRAWYEDELGCPLDRLWAWQFAGFDGWRMLVEHATLPRTSPIGEKCDLSAVTMADGMRRVGVMERVG